MQQPRFHPFDAGRRGVLRGMRSVAALVGAGLMLPGLCLSQPQARASGPARSTLLVLGDSLSAEYGLPRGSGWVALMTPRLKPFGDVSVVNASISGETTAGGLSRLPSLLNTHQPRWVVIELGANDALRGLPLKITQDNLSKLVAMSKAQGAQVLLVGMQMPPNFGQRYSDEFAALFHAVAQAHKVALVPFMLAGVADRPDARDWFQPDGIHPQAKAHPVILERNLWPAMQQLLRGHGSKQLATRSAPPPQHR